MRTPLVYLYISYTNITLILSYCIFKSNRILLFLYLRTDVPRAVEKYTVQILQEKSTGCKFFSVFLRVEYRITYSADTVPFRMCYCVSEVLYDRSDHVKVSVL